ncbi:uncharacterized protein [Palaemon carinicauda]|uniref:uncharacterized protein n=1 Tax=Palaemon carinicauda TaxID=392227 RepID=UPI0035B5D024
MTEISLADGQNDTLSERDRLEQNEHVLNITVGILILTIFGFFFMIIIVIFCLRWLEKRNDEKKQYLLLPSGSVPGYITIMSSEHPHLRLLGQYQFQSLQSKDKWTQGQMHYFSTPYLLSTYNIKDKKMRSY